MGKVGCHYLIGNLLKLKQNTTYLSPNLVYQTGNFRKGSFKWHVQHDCDKN